MNVSTISLTLLDAFRLLNLNQLMSDHFSPLSTPDYITTILSDCFRLIVVQFLNFDIFSTQAIKLHCILVKLTDV
jgi:hypothetical protein